MRVLVGCEESGVVTAAFRAAGHEAWSCDLMDTRGNPAWHIRDDVLRVVRDHGPWDLGLFFTPCTRLANSGVRWLIVPPPGRTLKEMWEEFEEGVALYLACRNAPIARKSLENPVMNPYAKKRLGQIKRHIVQPHFFGDPAFKATGFELHNLPPLQRTHWMKTPKPGTEEHKKWSAVHRMPPGPNRARDRSKTGIANAMASQWGAI